MAFVNGGDSIVKLLTQLSLFLLACSGFAASVIAADAPIVREVFACNYNAGKDMDDLMAVRDYFVRQLDKLDVGEQEHFVWTPYKTSAPYDFLWFSNSPNLIAFANDADTFNGSEAGQAVQARFEQVATCTSGLAMRQQFYTGAGEFSGDPANPVIIGSSACNYREGSGPDDLQDLLDHISGVLDSTNRSDGFLGFASRPMVAGPDAPDLYLYGVQGTVTDWAEGQAAMQASPGGPALGRHFRAVLDCSQSLWFGQRVVPLPE